MTSDRGQRGDAEMQLGNNPVTHKTLNPNADVFQVTKSPAASPDSTADSWQGSEVDAVNNAVSPGSPEAEGFTYMNGDASSSKLSSVVNYPPTPESPQLQVTDYQNLNGGINNSEILYQGNDVGQSDENGAYEHNIPEDQLRAMLKNQLEYYFSRENLSHDSYLVSQMDPDQFVPIATIAGFNQVKRLTSNMDLVVEVLRDSSNVQVDENGEKVRPLHKRCIVILREVPESTPVEDVKKLFSGENCPKFLTCEFAANNNWYVTFDSDEDAQRAYQYLREDIKTFLGKPIMARIKAKPNLYNSTFVPKNGFKATGNMAQFPVSPGAAAAAPQSIAGSQGGAETGQTPPGPFPQQQPQSQPQAQQQTQPISQHGYTFTTQVPSIQYIRNQNYPFFPPNAVMHPWPTSLQFFDPGTAFAANGYTPSSLKISGNTNRHGFQNMRNRNQKQGHMRGPPSHDRDSISTHNSRPPPPPRLANAHAHYHHNSHHQSSEHPQSNVHRSSPRNSDSFHGNVMHSDSGHGNSHTSHSASHSSVLHSQNSLDNGSGPMHSSGRQSDPAGSKDQNSQSSSRRPGYSGSNYKSRRRVHDDGAKTSRNASQNSAKESKHVESPKFELEATSFPPLPGSTNNTTTGDIFENKMSDVVKGTAKPSTRDTKTQTQPPSPASPSKEKEKEKEKNAAVNGASTLPTPPPTPQKASKSTSTETTVPVSSSNSKPEPAPATTMTTTSTQTTSAQTTQAKARAPQQPVRQPSEEKEKVVSTSSSGAIPPVKLSYAQMAQRGKSGPGNGGATTADTPSATGSQQTSAAPAAKESAASNSNTSNKPQTLKEQSQQTVSRRSPTSNENFRKDSTKDEPRESRAVGSRKAKENRDRITERDARDRKERDNDRPKERRRDRDLDQNVRPNQK